MFLDDTACNLASINLLEYYDTDSRTFQIEDFQHSVRLWTATLEISVLMAQFPSAEIAQKSYEYRTLGLGYCNLGSMLMHMGIPYDDDRLVQFVVLSPQLCAANHMQPVPNLLVF